MYERKAAKAVSRASEEEEVGTNLPPSTSRTISCCSISEAPLANDHVNYIHSLARFRLFDDEPVAWV